MASDRVPQALKQARERMRKHKWDELKKRGYNPPEDEAERQKRLKEAHGY